MPGIVHFETFLLTGILLNITPGNDTIFILTRSIGLGRRAGIVSTLGIATGSIFHTLLAAFGLSIIIAKSILLFNILKFAGAAYLIYLGYKMLTDRSQLKSGKVNLRNSVDYWKVYKDGVFTNLLNPKVALFFYCISTSVHWPHIQEYNFTLPHIRTTFIITGTIWCFILVLFASFIFGKLKTSKKGVCFINKICGLAMIGLGIRLALVSRK